jgi:superoxide dismutase, Fe-Mn family
MNYTPKTFTLPTLSGISDKQVAVHLALYAGYVKHYNLMAETLKGYASYGDKATEGDKYAIAELRRRVAFEFNGARLHEYYFEQFEGGQTYVKTDGAFAGAIAEKYGEQGLEGHIREVAGTRGIGWVVVYYDTARSNIVTTFVADHEIGQLAGLPILLALDLWEHAYMVDYVPAEKKNYIDAFFANVNWSVVEKRFEDAK